jgi:hypothetical protein
MIFFLICARNFFDSFSNLNKINQLIFSAQN